MQALPRSRSFIIVWYKSKQVSQDVLKIRSRKESYGHTEKQQSRNSLARFLVHSIHVRLIPQASYFHLQRIKSSLARGYLPTNGVNLIIRPAAVVPLKSKQGIKKD